MEIEHEKRSWRQYGISTTVPQQLAVKWSDLYCSKDANPPVSLFTRIVHVDWL